MCSISAVFSRTQNPQVLDDLLGLIYSGENRGSESVGAAVFTQFNRTEKGQIVWKKKMGSEGGIGALTNSLLSVLNGVHASRGVGQTRYSTTGQSNIDYAQPFLIEGRSSFIINHNGTVPNAPELVKKFGLPVRTQSDTEALGHLIARHGDIVQGIREASQYVVGGWNLTLMDTEGTIYIFRDPTGFSPLWYQYDGETLVASSEDVALSAIRRFNPQEVKPGELIVIGECRFEKHQIATASCKECPFEPVYFQKVGSTYRGNTVMDIRRKIGAVLGARETVKGADVLVVPILDSGRFYAEGFSRATGLPYAEGLMKNRGERVYMRPLERANGLDQKPRSWWAGLKNVAIPTIVRGKRVIVTDDSLVRGDTSAAVTRNLREAGAKEVHWRIGFPPITHGCIYKMDHSIRAKLIAAQAQSLNENVEKYITKQIGADSVVFATWEEIKPILKDRDDHCTACFTGEYPTKIPEKSEAAVAYYTPTAALQ